MKKHYSLLFPLFLLLHSCGSNIEPNTTENTSIKKEYPYIDTLNYLIKYGEINNPDSTTDKKYFTVPTKIYVKHISADSSIFLGSRPVTINGKDTIITTLDLNSLQKLDSFYF